MDTFTTITNILNILHIPIKSDIPRSLTLLTKKKTWVMEDNKTNNLQITGSFGCQLAISVKVRYPVSQHSYN